MLITYGGNILIRDIDAAMVLFSQHGTSGRLFRMVYEVSSAWLGIASSRRSSGPFLRRVRGESLRQNIYCLLLT